MERSLVISFPRSGINWLRHCVEHFGRVRTPGRPHLIAEGPLLFDRTHDVRKLFNRSEYAGLFHENGQPVYQRVALLLRDPIDCFVSHYLVRKRRRFGEALTEFTSFTNNIMAFDQLPGTAKEIFYFEEFANNEQGTFAFLRFFGIEPTGRTDFNQLIAASRSWYQGSHGLVSDSRRPVLSGQERTVLEEKLRLELGEKFESYLGRYFTEMVAPELQAQVAV